MYIVWKTACSTTEGSGACSINYTKKIPTNERLHKIGLSSTDRCRQCDKKHKIQHRLIECGNGDIVWKWARQKTATMLRMDPRYVPPERNLRPHIKLWPSQRQRAILWVMTQLVLYRVQQRRALTLHDYMDFLRQ